MGDVVKAKRAEIELGNRKIEVFQFPNGEYKLSQTQVAEAVGKKELSFRQFLTSKSLEALPYKGFKSVKFPVEDSPKPINAIPIKLAIAYWTKETLAGNADAARLLAASADLSGVCQKVLFIFECKNPIVTVSHIKECIYDRKYLEAARDKYEADHVFLFLVAPLGGEPKAQSYVDKRLAPDDEGYVRIISVKKMAEFLKRQIDVTNPQKKSEITKLYRKLLNYQIPSRPTLPPAST